MGTGKPNNEGRLVSIHIIMDGYYHYDGWMSDSQTRL